jgi:hypothetical protein
MRINTHLRFIFLVFILSVFAKVVYADDITEEVRNKLPKMLGANNVGTDFWITFNPCWETDDPLKNDLRVYVSCGIKTLVTVEVPGKSFKTTKMTIPNDIIEFRLDPGKGQCYQKDDKVPPEPERVYQGYGVHVYADYPIVVYGVTRYHYTSDGFLAIPVSSLGKEYIIASYADPTSNTGQWLPSYCGIVAAHDNTEVRFTLGGNGNTKTAGGMKPGDYKTEILNQGDVWLIGSLGAFADLSGSKIRASRPVAVLSGNFCAYIPSDKAACDYICEMELPTNTWGNDYHVSRIFTRLNNSIIKVFAKKPMTKLYRDGKQIGYIFAAGGMEGNGFQEMRAAEPYNQPKVSVISGDNPISVTQYNPGQQDDNVVSDPFQLVLTPLQQYQNEIVFNTPGVSGSGFESNYINIVYEANADGSMPQGLEFAKVENGVFTWVPLRDLSPAPGDRFAYDVEGKPFYSKIYKLDGDGVYKIRSDKLFTAYAYGFSSWDSYGFPTSVALGDLEKPDTLPPIPKWTQNTCTGDIFDGTVEDMPKDPEVRSNLSMIVFDPENSVNYRFWYKKFVPGEDFKTTWTLEVIDKLKEAVAFITYTDRRGNDTTIMIKYTPPKITMRPATVNFGSLKLGDVVEKSVWVINYSEDEPITITTVTLEKKNQHFQIMNLNVPYTLNPQDSIEVRIRFTADSIGSYADSVGTGDTCIFFYKPYIYAKVGQAQIDVTNIDFGLNVPVNTTVNKSFTITNTGSSELVITGYSLLNHADVYSSNLPKITPDNPLIIPPYSDNSKTFIVSFTPLNPVQYIDQIVFTSDAVSGDNVCEINGGGIKADLASTSINWKPLRINRSPYPATPSFSDCNDGGFRLMNPGTQEVRITSLEVVDAVPAEANDMFQFDRNQFQGFTIQPGGDIVIPINFVPTAIGNYYLKVRFVNSTSNIVESSFTGTGIQPRISITPTVDFGTTTVDDFISSPNTNTITVRNEGHTFGDSLVLSDIRVTSGVINEDMTQYSADGFKYNKAALGLPRTLHQNDEFTFPAYFVAHRTGDVNVAVTTLSDAEADQTSNWHGFGISQQPRVEGGTVDHPICVNKQATITCRLTIDGTGGNIRIDSIRFADPNMSQFVFEDPTILEEFYMEVGQSRPFNVIFSSSAPGFYSNDIIVYTNSLDYPVLRTTVSGTAVDYHRATESKMNKSAVNIGDKSIVYTIAMAPGVSIDPRALNLKKVKFTVDFKTDFIKTTKDNINATNGYVIEDLVFETDDVNKNQHIEFVLNASVGTFNDAEDLVYITMESFLPWFLEDNQNLGINTTTKIYHTSQPLETDCITLTSDSTSISLNNYCSSSLRPLVVAKGSYDFAPIVPNPINDLGGEIKFSLAFDGMVDINVYNINGEVVASIIHQSLANGSYSVRIPVEKLSSGRYWVKMSSGGYEKVQELIIAK